MKRPGGELLFDEGGGIIQPKAIHMDFTTLTALHFRHVNRHVMFMGAQCPQQVEFHVKMSLSIPGTNNNNITQSFHSFPAHSKMFFL